MMEGPLRFGEQLSILQDGVLCTKGKIFNFQDDPQSLKRHSVMSIYSVEENENLSFLN